MLMEMLIFPNSKIAGIAQSTQDTDAANKVYVDESIAGSAILVWIQQDLMIHKLG